MDSVEDSTVVGIDLTPANWSETDTTATINFVLWGAAGLAVIILLMRLLVAGVKRWRSGNTQNVFCYERSSCDLHEDQPPSYSQLSVHTLPPTYSHACRIINYRPSLEQTNGSSSSVGNISSEINVYRNQSFEVDFVARPSISNVSQNETVHARPSTQSFEDLRQSLSDINQDTNTVEDRSSTQSIDVRTRIILPENGSHGERSGNSHMSRESAYDFIHDVEGRTVKNAASSDIELQNSVNRPSTQTDLDRCSDRGIIFSAPSYAENLQDVGSTNTEP